MVVLHNVPSLCILLLQVDHSPHGCHRFLRVFLDGSEVTALRIPKEFFASVRVVPHTVGMGQVRSLSVVVLKAEKAVALLLIPVGHPSLCVDGLQRPGLQGTLSRGCCWSTHTKSRGMARFYNGGKGRRSHCGFVSGDVITAEVDRRYGTGVVRFYSNGDAVEAEPLPIAFSEEAVFVVTFGFEDASARIVGFS